MTSNNYHCGDWFLLKKGMERNAAEVRKILARAIVMLEKGKL